MLDVDHPPASPQTQASPSSPSPPPATSTSMLARSQAHLNGSAQSWSSPAFLKRKAPSSTPYLNSFCDPFADEDDYREVSPTKRTKFGRKSAEWRFTDRTPSPILRPVVQIEQQVEQQVEDAIRTPSAEQQQGPFSAVSEPDERIEERVEVQAEEGDQSPAPGNDTSGIALDPELHIGVQNGKSLQQQEETDRQVPSTESGIDQPSLVSENEARGQEATEDQVEEVHSPTSERSYEPTKLPPAESLLEPVDSNLELDMSSLARPHNDGEPLSNDVATDGMPAFAKKTSDATADDNSRAGSRDSLFSEEYTPEIEPSINGEQTSPPIQIMTEYLRRSNADQISSPVQTLDDILRRSNREVTAEPGRPGQNANIASPISVIELSSSSPVQVRSSPQPPSEEDSLQSEEGQDPESDDELEEGGSEQELFSDEDAEEDYPSELNYSEVEDEYGSDEERARMKHGRPHAMPPGTAYEEDDLSEGDYSQEDDEDESDEGQKPYINSNIEEHDPKLQALQDMLSEEDHDSEAEDVDDMKEGSEHASSDSDVIMMDGPPEQVQQGLPRRKPDPREPTAEDEEQSESPTEDIALPHYASSFGYDGSAFSRPQSKVNAVRDVNESKPAIITTAEVQAVDSTANQVGENGKTQTAAVVDVPSNDRSVAREGIRTGSQGLESSVQDGSNQLHTESIGEVSPRSAAWAALEQLQEESHTEPSLATARDGVRQLQQASLAQSPSKAHIATHTQIDAATEQGAYNQGLRVREGGPVSEEGHLSEEEGSVHSLGKESVDHDEAVAAAEDAENMSEDQELVQSEVGDYWDENDEVSEGEHGVSEGEDGVNGPGQPEPSEDEDEIQYDDSPDLRDEGTQRSGNGLGKNFPVKSSAVEIIDLESTDEEASTPKQEPLEVKPLYHDLPRSVPTEDADPQSSALEQHDIEPVRQENIEGFRSFETQVEIPQDALGGKALAEQVRETGIMRKTLPMKSSKREINDTYSEDAGFTEPELAENPSPSLEQVELSPSQTNLSTSPELSSTNRNSRQPTVLRAQEEAKRHEVEPAPEQGQHEWKVGSRDPSLARSVEALVIVPPPRGETDINETQLTVRPSEPRLQEIPESATQDQPMVKLLDETRQGIIAATQLSEHSGPSADQDDVDMIQDGMQVQLNDVSDEEFTQEYSLEDLQDELEQRTQLPTPTTTQVTKTRSELSDSSLKHEVEEDLLPTPSLTQKTSEIIPSPLTQERRITSEPSDGPLRYGVVEESLVTSSILQKTSEVVPPTTPAPARKISLIQKLKEMRSETANKRRSSLIQDTPSAASPWFGPRRSSRLAPDTDQEPAVGVEEETGRDGDVSSEVERESQPDNEPSLPRQPVASPSLGTNLLRFPSSSPPPPPIQQKTGFRTNLSYFAPLNTMRSHYNATTSVLGLVIASTPLDRATSGPKDYHTTIYITDPSSSDPPSVTSARIFRPSKFAFPNIHQGDAILLRSFRVVSYRKQLGLLSTDSSAWAVFRRGEEPQIRGPPVEFGAEERGFARGLWDWWAAVEKEDFINAVPSDRSPRKGREGRGGKGRASVLRHELRDGTTYVDRRKGDDDDSVHELRDGTRWSDSKP